MIYSVYVLLACCVVVVLRIIGVSGIYDRLLAVNVFNTCMVVAIMALGIVMNSHEFFIDIALVYACVGLVASVGFARFFLYGGWGE